MQWNGNDYAPPHFAPGTSCNLSEHQNWGVALEGGGWGAWVDAEDGDGWGGVRRFALLWSGVMGGSGEARLNGRFESKIRNVYSQCCSSRCSNPSFKAWRHGGTRSPTESVGELELPFATGLPLDLIKPHVPLSIQ
jgi:hypothetical protein